MLGFEITICDMIERAYLLRHDVKCAGGRISFKPYVDSSRCSSYGVNTMLMKTKTGSVTNKVTTFSIKHLQTVDFHFLIKP